MPQPWPYNNQLKEPRPADWGIGMTVCIAVGCEFLSNAPRIIMVSDTQVAMGVTSSHALKARRLSEQWSVMIAGDDVSYAEDVIALAVETCAGRASRNLADAAFSTTKAYQSVRREQIEQELLSSYNLTIEEFLGKSPDFPTPTKRQSLLDEIDHFDLGCEFLIAGFGDNRESPQIFQVKHPGRYVSRSLVGYWAIGSGSINAITYLARREQRVSRDFETSLYNAIAAKKLAEKADGVGEDTIVYVVQYGVKGVAWQEQEQVEEIVTMWRDEESLVRPANLESRVKQITQPPQQAMVVAASDAKQSISETSKPQP
jgi:hypothetical protein